MIGLIAVTNGDVLAAVRGFLKNLLENRLVDALYVPMQIDGGSVAPALVSDPARLDQADPLAPVMSINGARAVSAITGKKSPARLGVVLRSCETRALYELVKLQQASLDDVTVISLDCPGTFELSDVSHHKDTIRLKLDEYLAAAQEGRTPAFDDLSLRPACQMCVQPLPDHADIALHLFGVDVSMGIPVVMGDELAEKLAVAPAAGVLEAGRQQVVERLIEGRLDVRKKELADVRSQLASNSGMAGLFADCIRCHNCMTVCPICYCKTCLFKTAAFDHEPEHYLLAAHQKGATRMMGDTLLFQMTRLNHMSISCVSCGMCTSACPAEIPVGAIFSAIGEQVAAAFDYAAGRDLAETLPLVTFQANELTEVGEAR
jgi:formate dehydrogenase (coenzyme F420) beta subunit